MAEGATAASASIPLYIIICGFIMAAITWLSRPILVFLRMFNAGFAITFATFAVLFLVQAMAAGRTPRRPGCRR